MKEKSKALKTRQGKDCKILNHTSDVIQLGLPLFATVKSVPQNSDMIWTNKPLICNPSTRAQKLSKILDRDSTSKEFEIENQKIQRNPKSTIGTVKQVLDSRLVNTRPRKTD